jgi:hypothetical protein
MGRLGKLLHTGDPELRAVATEHTRELKSPGFRPGTNLERCNLLLRAIPLLIAALDGRQSGLAYGILLFLQPGSAPADRTFWEKWWNDEGRANLVAMLGAS